MNPKLDVIFSRRSIRKQQDKPVPEESITNLLEAAWRRRRRWLSPLRQNSKLGSALITLGGEKKKVAFQDLTLGHHVPFG